jgi:hypothetical protein
VRGTWLGDSGARIGPDALLARANGIGARPHASPPMAASRRVDAACPPRGDRDALDQTITCFTPLR